MKKWASGLIEDLPDSAKDLAENGDVMFAFNTYWAQVENYILTIPRKNRFVGKDTAQLGATLLVADELRKIRKLLEKKNA